MCERVYTCTCVYLCERVYTLAERVYTCVFPDDSVPATITSSTVLPWGAPKERSRLAGAFNIDPDIRPGEFVMRTLFAEFTLTVDKKISNIMTEELAKPLSKSLQRGEDAHFDQGSQSAAITKFEICAYLKDKFTPVDFRL